MNATDARAIVDRHFDERAVKEAVIRIARSRTPQTELYEREPQILRAIRTMYRPAFESFGCDTWIDDYGNLIATQGKDEAGQTVMFMSFAMAWMEGTMSDPWSGEVMDGKPFDIDGEVVWGRGGSEYHPTNAAMLECARIVHESGVDIPGKIIYVVSSGGHSSSSDPVYHIIHNDQLTADLCITVGSPLVVLGNMGRLDLRVKVYGKSVHSGGELEVGLNAIEGGLRALERVEKIMPFPPKGVQDPDMGQGRLSIIGLGSYPFSPGYHDGVGSGGHTLQNLMRIMLDRRLAPGQDVQAAVDEIRDAIGDMTPWRVTFERGALQYPTKHQKDDKIVKSLVEAYKAALDKEPSYGYVDYTIDAGYMNIAGIPTIMFGGIDMRFAHGDTDVTSLPVTYRVAKVLTTWAITNATQELRAKEALPGDSEPAA
jgi:acetylornithine deacetylase/succinyl-diaminopimelate desuccinylase-like protein